MLGRRSFLTVSALSVAGIGAHLAARGLNPGLPVETLDPAPVTFGEWELFVLDTDNASVLVIDPDRETLLAQWPIGGRPTGLLQSINRRMAVAVDTPGRRLTIIRQRAALEKLTISVDLQPSLVAISPTGNILAVLDQSDGKLALFDSETGLELARTAGMAGADNLLFDRFGDTLYVTGKGRQTIERIDPNDLRRQSAFRIEGVEGLDRLVPVRGDTQMLALPSAGTGQRPKLIDLGADSVEGTIDLPSPVSTMVLDITRSWMHAASVSRPEIYRRSILTDHQVILEAPQIADQIFIGGVGSFLGATNKEQPGLMIFDLEKGVLDAIKSTPGVIRDSFYNLWSRKTFLATSEEDIICVVDDNLEIRSIRLEGYSPAMIAKPGAAICHA